MNGLTGLTNLGNTCFINSTIQLLSHTEEFNDFLNKRQYLRTIKERKKTNLILEYDMLRRMMWKKNCIISPARFIDSIQKVSKEKNIQEFMNWDQNDMPEFLFFLLDTFHNEISREVDMEITGKVKNSRDKVAIKCFKTMQQTYEKDYSEIINIFFGVNISTIHDVKTDEVLSVKCEPYSMIDVCLPMQNMGQSHNHGKQYSIQELLKSNYKPEKLDGENMWFNEETNKKQAVIKKHALWNVPNVLIIAIKRFTYSGTKMRNPVHIPDVLDMKDYVAGYNPGEYKYELYGICNHRGSNHGGHYNCLVKKENNWLMFNDTNIQVVKPNNVSAEAYCLFYKKIKV